MRLNSIPAIVAPVARATERVATPVEQAVVKEMNNAPAPKQGMLKSAANYLATKLEVMDKNITDRKSFDYGLADGVYESCSESTVGASTVFGKLAAAIRARI